MYNLVRADLKKILLRVEMYTSVLLTVVCMFIGVGDELKIIFKNDYQTSVFRLYYNSIFTGIIDTVLPLVCIIPIVQTLWEEKNGCREMVLLRTKKLNYVVSKLLVSIVSGIFVIYVGSIVFVVILRCLGIPWVLEPQYTVINDTVYYKWISENKLVQSFALIIFNYSLTTVPWTMMSLVLSNCIKNKHMLILAPMLIQKIMIYVCYEFEELFYLNPVTWNVASNITFTSKFGGMIYIGVVATVSIIIGSILYCCRFKRGLKYGE